MRLTGQFYSVTPDNELVEKVNKTMGKTFKAPGSVLLHDFHFKIEVGLPTCIGKPEAWSHGVLGNPRWGCRSVWISASRFHRNYSIPIQLCISKSTWFV